MSHRYLSALARLDLNNYAARSKSAARERAGRAARLAADHPVKTAAAVASVALVGALVVGAASAETPEPRVAHRLNRAGKGRATAKRLFSEEEMSAVPNVARVFVHLGISPASKEISTAERIRMKNAMPIAKADVAEIICDAHEFADKPFIKVESGTAIVVARGKCDALSGLVSSAHTSRIVVLHIGDSAFGPTEEGWRKYETKVNVEGKELQITAHVYSVDPCTVLVDADDTFFACTLIRNASLIDIHSPISVIKHGLADEGGKLRAESMFVCHQKVRGQPIVDVPITVFDRVFVVSPRGPWPSLTPCLKCHGLIRIGPLGVVTWIAKRTMLVLVSPAYGVSTAYAFVMHCELHNLRIQARKNTSDVRFTIGFHDARLLANKEFSDDGPRWTRTCDMFAPFYARSPYVVITVGPVAIYSSLDRALAPVQTVLDARTEDGLVNAMTKLTPAKGGDDTLAGLDTELAVFRDTNAVSLSIASGSDEIGGEVGDVVLIAKSAIPRVESEKWVIVGTSGEYSVYRHKNPAPGFGRRFCLYTP